MFHFKARQPYIQKVKRNVLIYQAQHLIAVI